MRTDARKIQYKKEAISGDVNVTYLTGSVLEATTSARLIFDDSITNGSTKSVYKIFAARNKVVEVVHKVGGIETSLGFIYGSGNIYTDNAGVPRVDFGAGDKVDKVFSTDNAIARYDGTTGSVQDSTATIDDVGNMTVLQRLTVGNNVRSVYSTDSTLDHYGYFSAWSNSTHPTAPSNRAFYFGYGSASNKTANLNLDHATTLSFDGGLFDFISEVKFGSTVQIPTNKGVGKIFTSDINGFGKWEDSPTINADAIKDGYDNTNPRMHGGSLEWSTFLSYPFSKLNYSEYGSQSTASIEVTGAYRTIIGDHFIKADLNKKYKFHLGYKNPTSNTVAVSNCFTGVYCHDRLKNPIEYYHSVYFGNTLTELTQPLNDGDTVIHVTSTANWSINVTDHTRSINMWRQRANGKFCYEDADGFQYDEHGYTRDSWYSNLYPTTGLTPTTIILTAPWSGGSFAVGDKIANSHGGAGYTYWESNFVLTQSDTWQENESTGWRTGEGAPSNIGASTGFPLAFLNGTHYYKPIVLTNRGSGATDIIYYDEIGLKSIAGDVTGSEVIPLLNGWVDFGAGYEGASISISKDGVVHISGLIRSGTITDYTDLALLPDRFRPKARLMFSVKNGVSSGNMARLDVLADGRLQIFGATNSTWLSLSGISYKIY